jgi:hypothetical protein
MPKGASFTRALLALALVAGTVAAQARSSWKSHRPECATGGADEIRA